MQTRPRAMLAAAALSALVLAAPPAAKAGAGLPKDCKRFSAAESTHFDTTLGRLCAYLIGAAAESDPLSTEETRAAERLAEYMAVVLALDLRGARVERPADGGKLKITIRRRTGEASRYLIARELGLLAIADRITPRQLSGAIAAE